MQSRVVREPEQLIGPPVLPVIGSLRFAYCLSAWVAALLAIASIGGLLRGRNDVYQPDPLLLPQLLGQDAFSLLVCIPLLLASMWMTRRGSLRGMFLWLGMLFYVAYSYSFYIVGVQFGPLFLVYIALVSASLYAMLGMLARIDPAGIRHRFGPELPARLISGFLVATGVLFMAMWVGDVFRRLRAGEPLDPVSHAVYAIDLVVALPATLVVGIALWRRQPWGYALAGLLLVKMAALMLTLLVNTVLVLRAGQSVDEGQIAAYSVTAIAATALTAAYLRAVREIVWEQKEQKSDLALNPG